MSPKPQQRTQQQRTPQPRATDAPTPSTQSRAVRPAQSNAPTRQAPRGDVRTGTGSTEFERLMRANTVRVGHGTAARRRKSPLLGKVAFALAIASVAVDASAFAVFMGGDGTFAFGICFVVVFLTFLAAVLGFIAAVGAMGRWYGVAGVLIGFAANPVVLIVVLVFIAPDMATEFGA